MDVVTNSRIRMKNDAINSYTKSKNDVTKNKTGNNTITFHKHSGYCASGDLARLAAARNVQDVKSVSRMVEFKMARAKRSGASRSEIKSSLRQMEKVIGKAKKKIKGLKKEEQLKAQEKCAEKAKKEKLRKRREEEYQEHKRKRQARERCEVAAPYPTTSEGARHIAEEAYRKAMENICQSHLDSVPEGSTVDVAVDDTMIVDGGCTVDAAGAAVDMAL